MTDRPLARWCGDAEANARPGPLLLPVVAQEVRTPGHARQLADAVGVLAGVFLARDARGEAGPHDDHMVMVLRDVAGALRDHAKALEWWHELQAAEFTAAMPADAAELGGE